MKRLFFISALCLGTITASAEIKFKSLDNDNGTNIVLVDNETPEKTEVTDALLLNYDKEYRAKHIRCNIVNGTTVYHLKFKRLTKFKDCLVTLTVNGEKITVPVLNSSPAK